MPKVKGPLLSQKASGRLGNTLVYSSWRGISYVRQYCRPKVRKSQRLQRVTGLYGQQTKRWGKLPEKARQAWAVFSSLLGAKASPHVIFAHYSALALDVGFPEPVFPPRPRKLAPPRLKLKESDDGKVLVLSWKAARLPAKAVVDVYFCTTRASVNPHPHVHHHLDFLPVKEPGYVLRDLKPNMRYSFRARLVLPDSSHSPFSTVSLIHEG
jgi:hypothetical protein